MNRTILIALAVTLPLTLCVPVLQAETPHAAKNASQMSESGPMVMGGSGATAGPNHRNQAVVPMPGLREQEREQELSELPPLRPIRLPDVRPITGAPAAKR